MRQHHQNPRTVAGTGWRLFQSAAVAIALGFATSAQADRQISIISTGEAYSNALKAAAEVFTERTGIEVEIDQFPYGQAYNKMVLAGTSGSSEYDLMTPDCIWLPLFMKNGWVQSLESLETKAENKIDWDGFFPGIVDAYDKWKGERYAMPIDFFIEVLAYLPDKLEAAGLEGPPRTWAEFERYAKKLNAPENDFYGVITMPGGQDAGYSEWTVRLAGQQMPPNSNQFVWNKDFEPVFNWRNQGTKALKEWLDIKPYTPPASNEMGYAESVAAFSNGEGAMFLNWYMVFSDVENPETSQVAGDVAYALPPRTPGDGPKHEYLGGFQMAISSRAENPELAHRFMAFLSTDEGQELMLENGAPGAYKEFVYSSEKWLERYPFLKPVKNAEKLVPLTSDFAEYVEMQRLMYNQISAAWVGNKSPSEAMSTAEEDLEALFQDLGYTE